MNDFERQWIDYAWGVVACTPAHAADCRRSGGVGVADGSDVRFPGFIGPDYEPGRGVLCMGHVHRYLPDRDDVEGGRLHQINDALLTWRTSGRGEDADASFLAESRSAYMASAPTWDYWNRNYAPLLREARVPLREVAFANVAKCRTTTEDDSAALDSPGRPVLEGVPASGSHRHAASGGRTARLAAPRRGRRRGDGHPVERTNWRR